MTYSDKVPDDLTPAEIKRSAQQKLNDAVNRGLITKGRCAVCQLPNTIAHHHDYAKPLDVVWLCRYHHGQAHRELNNQRKKNERDYLQEYQERRKQESQEIAEDWASRGFRIDPRRL